MIRLFKLLFVIVIVSAAYFSLQKHAAQSTRFHSITTQHKVKVAFPGQVAQQTKTYALARLGSRTISVYQAQAQQQLFVLLEVEADVSALSRAQLNKVIHQLNNTQAGKLIHEQHFALHGQPTYDYAIRDQRQHVIYCRTLQTPFGLLSLIYASDAATFDKTLHKDFFDSLKL